MRPVHFKAETYESYVGAGLKPAPTAGSVRRGMRRDIRRRPFWAGRIGLKAELTMG